MIKYVRVSSRQIAFSQYHAIYKKLIKYISKNIDFYNIFIQFYINC